ncbi:MAG: hypothetical protein ACOYNG_02685 [Terrimicrobiaceae bacterium]|jgi:hypothetical protein
MKSIAIILSASCVLLFGCASSLSSRAQKLELGVSKDRVTKVLGKRFTVVAAREDAGGSRIEVLRFEEQDSGEFFVYLRDERLVQWGDVRALDNMPQ